jgi:hypothetical protein
MPGAPGREQPFDTATEVTGMITSKLWKLACGSAFLAVVSGPAGAQGTVPDSPQITEIGPPSGQRGTPVEVTLNGQKLAGTRELMCRYSAHPALIPPVERGVKAQVTSAADGQIKARLTIAADAPPGLHEIRALTAQGVTPAQYFYVSQYAQAPEQEPNNAPAQANKITLPATVAGVINGGEDQDTFSFTAKRGERLVFDVEGFKRFAPPQNNQQGVTYLDSFIALRDGAGAELAYADDNTRVDALLAYQFAADGTYFITVRDNQYRGRGDFHYRLTIGSQPYVTAVFPPGGQKGSRLVATVFGYNLDSQGSPSVKRSVDLSDSPGTQEFRIATAAGMSNALPVVSGGLEEASEVEPNERPQDATPVITPICCNGMFHSLQDVDGFRFQAQGNQRLVFDVQASRLGSPVDTYLTLMTRSGKVIARDDDGGGMPDARLEVTIPETDEYVVFVRNQVKTGAGPQQFYRLTVRPLQPGFGATFRRKGVDGQGNPADVPVDAVPVPQGGTVDFEVLLNRYEGQGGDVQLALNMPLTTKGLSIQQVIRTVPPGEPANSPKARETLVAAPAVKNGQNSATIRLSAAPDMPLGSYTNLYLRLNGMAGSQPHVINKPFWVTVAARQ